MVTSVCSNNNFKVPCVIFGWMYDFYKGENFTHWTLPQSITCADNSSACIQKGCGYHLDLLVVAVMLAVCSVMGLPWFVAATVLSISHVNSLKVASESTAPGEQPHFLGIREQRVTGFMIFTLMGCSVFLTSVLKVRVFSTALPASFADSLTASLPLSPSLSFSLSASLQLIPMPVLYGVFLFMGVSSLDGIQVCFSCILGSAPLPYLTMSTCSSLTESSCWPCHPNTSRT